jgi:hypothetical protein
MGMIFGGQCADDGGIAIVTNGSNGAIVTGFTNNSFNFPRTALGLDAGFVFSLPMGFVTQVTAVGSSPGTIVRSATITATNGFVSPTGIATDNKTDGIYISGVTNSPSFPRAVTPGPNSANMGFVMKVPHDFSQILYSVLLGQTLT